MAISMDLNQARFTLTDVIKMGTAVVFATVAWVTLQNSVTNINSSVKGVAESVQEIRESQLENSKKNELRWQVSEARLNQIESNQRLFDQRLDQLEKK